MIAEFGIAKTLEATHEEVIYTIRARPTLSEATYVAILDSRNYTIHFKKKR